MNGVWIKTLWVQPLARLPLQRQHTKINAWRCTGLSGFVIIFMTLNHRFQSGNSKIHLNISYIWSLHSLKHFFFYLNNIEMSQEYHLMHKLSAAETEKTVLTRTLSWDLDTLPRWSTSRAMNACQMDFSSSSLSHMLSVRRSSSASGGLVTAWFWRHCRLGAGWWGVLLEPTTVPICQWENVAAAPPSAQSTSPREFPQFVFIIIIILM